MLKKYVGITLVAASMMTVACSSSKEVDEVKDVVDGSASSMESGDDNSDEVDTSDNDDTLSDNELTFVEASEDFGNSVMGIIVAQPDTTLFESAVLQAADSLDVTLHDSNNNWTVFVPKDPAMEGVNADRAVLLGHIHSGFLKTENLTGLVGSTVGVTSGAALPITMADDGVTLQINGVNIVQSDIVGDNGVVHKLDGVL